MNILFVTKDYVNPQSGGIGRITYVLAVELKRIGFACLSAYLESKNQLRSQDAVFMEEILLKVETHDQQVLDLLESCKIDFIVVQGVDSVMNQELMLLRKVIDKQSRRIPIFFVFHQMPGYELCWVDAGYLLRKIFSKECAKYVKQLLIQTIGKINKHYACRQLYSKYNIPYTNADKVVLLSKTYIDEFNSLARGDDKTKYAAIPNMLTYSEEECCVSTIKDRIVLMVARMDEQAKRIKRALQIWNRMPREILEDGWKLTIVGDGGDLPYYKQYVEKHNIKNVSFEGKQNPLPYYQRASIFMMTSSFEGWPMTLMEAMQNGCVPIVFDSFKAVYDIVESNKNGIIVANDDEDTYLKELERLMREDDYRKQLAKKALEDCKRFNKESVVNQWMALFRSYGGN